MARWPWVHIARLEASEQSVALWRDCYQRAFGQLIEQSQEIRRLSTLLLDRAPPPVLHEPETVAPRRPEPEGWPEVRMAIKDRAGSDRVLARRMLADARDWREADMPVGDIVKRIYQGTSTDIDL